MKPGEVFNPWRGACGFYPPDVFSKQRDIADGEKRLYERLVRTAGKNGKCFPSHKWLAEALGKSPRQIRYDIEKLEARSLIRHTRNGKRLSNNYVFLWHEMFEGDRQPIATHPEQEPPPDADSDRQSVADHDGGTADGEWQPIAGGDRQCIARGEWQPIATELSQETPVHEGLSSSEAAVGTVPIEPTTTPSLDSPKPLAAFLAEHGIPEPRGEFPGAEIKRLLADAGAVPDDLKAFLENYVAHLKEPPCVWKHLVTSLERYLAGPEFKGRVDFRRQAVEIEAERTRAAEEKERIAITPVPIRAAVERLMREQVYPERDFLEALERKGIREIAPRELRRLFSTWKSANCEACHRAGLVGSAALKTRAFCSCRFGDERRQYEPDAAERGIRDANASIKARLVAGFHELGMPFTADAVEGSEITEEPGIIVVRASRVYALAFRDTAGFQRGLDYLGDRRAFDVILGDKTEAA